MRSYLSGLLIGDELASAVPDEATEVFLIGAPTLTALYEAALGDLGHKVMQLDSDAVAAGLFGLAQRVEG